MNNLNDKGERHGYWEFYYPNGNISRKGYFVNDKFHGYWEDYFQNGRLYWKGQIINEKRVGYWEWYSSRHDNLEEKEFYL